MVERRSVWRSRRRPPAAVAFGLRSAYPESLLLLGSVSLMAGQRVAAGQPYTVDRRAQRLSGHQAQAVGRQDRRFATIAARTGTNRPCVTGFRTLSGTGPAGDRRREISMKLP